MHNGKDYINQNNEFLHNLDFEKLFWKIVGALLVFEVLNNNIYLNLIDYYNFLFFNFLFR